MKLTVSKDEHKSSQGELREHYGDNEIDMRDEAR